MIAVVTWSQTLVSVQSLSKFLQCLHTCRPDLLQSSLMIDVGHVSDSTLVRTPRELLLCLHAAYTGCTVGCLADMSLLLGLNKPSRTTSSRRPRSAALVLQ